MWLRVCCVEVDVCLVLFFWLADINFCACLSARLLGLQRHPTSPSLPPTHIDPPTPCGANTPPIAPQVRAGLAALGLRSLDELIGRADLLRQRDAKLAKTSGLNLSFLTTFAGGSDSSSKRLAQQVHSNGPQLDDVILADKVRATTRGKVCGGGAAGSGGGSSVSQLTPTRGVAKADGAAKPPAPLTPDPPYPALRHDRRRCRRPSPARAA